MSKPVVVAVDGSESALRATRWAAAEARRRGRALRIVHAYQWPPVGGPTFAMFEANADAVQESAESVVRAAAETIPEVACRTEIILGSPFRCCVR